MRRKRCKVTVIQFKRRKIVISSISDISTPSPTPGSNVTDDARLPIGERIARQVARSVAYPGGSLDNFRDDPAFRYDEVATRTLPMLRTGRYLAVIGPFDPAGWPSYVSDALFSMDRGLDAEGRAVLGCVEFRPPRLRVASVPASPLSESDITERVIAEAGLIATARCRSGSLAGFSLGRALFGPDLGAALFDVPALFVRLRNFRPGNPPARNTDIPGESLCPGAFRDGRSIAYNWNQWMGAVGEADIARFASLPLDRPDGWNRPLIPGWICNEPCTLPPIG